jgi:hypothetical protein
MNFIFANPPKRERKRSYLYDSLFAALQARPGEWAKLDADTKVRTPERRSTALIASAKFRGLRIQTAVRNGDLYVCFRGPWKPKQRTIESMTAEERRELFAFFDTDEITAPKSA